MLKFHSLVDPPSAAIHFSFIWPILLELNGTKRRLTWHLTKYRHSNSPVETVCVEVWDCFHGWQEHSDAPRVITINGKHRLVKLSRSPRGLESECLEWLLAGKQKRNWSKTQWHKLFSWFRSCGLRSLSLWKKKKKIGILTLSSPIRRVDKDWPTRMDNHRLNVLSLAHPLCSPTINVSGSHQPRALAREQARGLWPNQPCNRRRNKWDCSCRLKQQHVRSAAAWLLPRQLD